MTQFTLIRSIFAAALSGMLLTVAAPATAQPKIMTIGTGGVTGVYYAVGGALCRLVNRDRAKSGIRCTVEASAGSVANVDSLTREALAFGMVQSDVSYSALKGIGAFEKGGARTQLRSVISLYPEMLTVLAGKDVNAAMLADLKKKRLSVGISGSGSRALVEDWFTSNGWQPEDRVTVQERTADEQGYALCENKIDAMAYVVGHPAPNVARTLKECGARLVALNAQNVDKYLETRPYAVRAEIPVGVYPSSTAPVSTVAVMAVLTTHAAVSDDMVYSAVKSIFENLDELKTLHPALANLDPKKMVTQGLTAPLHPGALRYYKEKGWL